ncbi:hypothetical protein [Mesorhizobium sp. ISC15]|uniref:hypothetical protein n=1 Tax=Mesorhizobium sp. ISC15 TaxID=3076429 RepID=UPI003FA597BC
MERSVQSIEQDGIYHVELGGPVEFQRDDPVFARRTKPFTSKTIGKAERFIQAALIEWAYGKAYDA